MTLPQPVERLWDELERARAELLREAEGLSQRQADWKPSERDWSVGEIVDHLTLAEVNTGKLTTKLLKELPGNAAVFPSELTEFAPNLLDDFKPDFTLMLDIDVEAGLKRAGARGNAESRFENFDRDFHERLRQAFLDIARRNPDRCAIIDAAADEDMVASAIWAAVARRFGL